MKQFNKLTILVVLILALPCYSTYKWSALNENISTEQVMQERFPSLYAKSKSGEIVIDKIEQRTDKNGEIIFRVRYTEKTSDNDINISFSKLFMTHC